LWTVKKKIHLLFRGMFLCGALTVLLQPGQAQSRAYYSTTPWSVRMAQSDMARQPGRYIMGYRFWDYVIGVELTGFEQLWRTTNDTVYYQYIKSTVDAAVNSSGTSITGYFASSYTLDNINEGKAINFLYSITHENKYKSAAALLRNQLKTHPRTSEGGFWHKQTYPYQMWLDGLYMASPFCAEYGTQFSEPSIYDSVVTQFVLMETHARDPVTGLLSHGWDEKKVSQWADPSTGCSPSFWGRAIGWYTMALVDVLDELPAGHTGRSQLIGILRRLALGIKQYQDSLRGTWYQVMDQGSRSGNWREASASCMFVYTVAKAVRMGYIDSTYLAAAKKGYVGILNEFISINNDSTITLNKICASAGLDAAAGGVRDGSFNYYVNNSGTQPVSNDGKGTGSFIMASIELERMGFIVPPLHVTSTFAGDSVLLSWNDRTYNALSFIIERKISTETEFVQIGEAVKGHVQFIDKALQGNTKYIYRMRAKSIAGFSDYSPLDSITTLDVPTGIRTQERSESFELMQNYPNPCNAVTNIKFKTSSDGAVTLEVFDILGRKTATLMNGITHAGIYSVQWDAAKSPSGIYFFRLQSGGKSFVQKFVLTK